MMYLRKTLSSGGISIGETSPEEDLELAQLLNRQEWKDYLLPILGTLMSVQSVWYSFFDSLEQPYVHLDAVKLDLLNNESLLSLIDECAEAAIVKSSSARRKPSYTGCHWPRPTYGNHTVHLRLPNTYLER